LPGISGLEAIPQIKMKYPTLDIIMLTAFDEHEKIFKALQSGACSYLTKSTSLDNIMETVRIVFNGGSYIIISLITF
jgi:DNA-binding NarL/FixJ family response regulator